MMQEVQGMVFAVLCLEFFIVLSLFPCGTCKAMVGFNLIYWPEKMVWFIGVVWGFVDVFG